MVSSKSRGVGVRVLHVVGGLSGGSHSNLTSGRQRGGTNATHKRVRPLHKHAHTQHEKRHNTHTHTHTQKVVTTTLSATNTFSAPLTVNYTMVGGAGGGGGGPSQGYSWGGGGGGGSSALLVGGVAAAFAAGGTGGNASYDTVPGQPGAIASGSFTLPVGATLSAYVGGGGGGGAYSGAGGGGAGWYGGGGGALYYTALPKLSTGGGGGTNRGGAPGNTTAADMPIPGAGGFTFGGTGQGPSYATGGTNYTGGYYYKDPTAVSPAGAGGGYGSGGGSGGCQYANCNYDGGNGGSNGGNGQGRYSAGGLGANNWANQYGYSLPAAAGQIGGGSVAGGNAGFISFWYSPPSVSYTLVPGSTTCTVEGPTGELGEEHVAGSVGSRPRFSQ